MRGERAVSGLGKETGVLDQEMPSIAKHADFIAIFPGILLTQATDGVPHRILLRDKVFHGVLKGVRGVVCALCKKMYILDKQRIPVAKYANSMVILHGY